MRIKKKLSARIRRFSPLHPNSMRSDRIFPSTEKARTRKLHVRRRASPIDRVAIRVFGEIRPNLTVETESMPGERDLVREEVALSSDVWVVKVGTGVLTRPEGSLDLDRIDRLVDQIGALMDRGKRVALVSSGAVGAAIGELNLAGRPDNLPQLQAAAAIGQSYLMRAYNESFRRLGKHAGQLLLTHDDFDDRSRYLNTRNTLRALFEWNAIPVINENDTISVAEIKFGDNDRLAAMVANLLESPLLVILSVIDGLYSADPAIDPSAEVVPLVPKIDESTLGAAGSSRSKLGTGGMQSKLLAARLVTRAGGSVIVASGREPDTLTRILAGERVGTLFLAQGRSHGARHRWIGLTARPRGYYVVDSGARDALVQGKKSLLAIGVVEVSGRFGKGDVVGVRDRDGIEFARGLTNYDSTDAAKIQGLRAEEARIALGAAPYAELVHKDNLVLTL